METGDEINQHIANADVFDQSGHQNDVNSGGNSNDVNVSAVSDLGSNESIQNVTEAQSQTVTFTLLQFFVIKNE